MLPLLQRLNRRRKAVAASSKSASAPPATSVKAASKSLSIAAGELSLSATGLELIKHFEGLYLTAYLCPANVWTIGYGHTGRRHNDGTVFKGLKISRIKASELLAEDMAKKYVPDVRRLITVPLTQAQFDALVSFHFNTGALGRSTLRRKLNAGDYAGAAAEFDKWTRGGGKVLKGLVRRRRSERHLFETGQLKFFT
jgi:lysozyme